MGIKQLMLRLNFVQRRICLTLHQSNGKTEVDHQLTLRQSNGKAVTRQMILLRQGRIRAMSGNLAQTNLHLVKDQGNGNSEATA